MGKVQWKSKQSLNTLIGKWVILEHKGYIYGFPVYVIEIVGRKIRCIFSDFSGAEILRTANFYRFATRSEVELSLKQAIQEILNRMDLEEI
jgi:hypothetical protein